MSCLTRLYVVISRRSSVVRSAVTLSYKVVGDSILYPEEPPILIFHGMLQSKRNWELIGKTLQSFTKRAVFAVDLRNHGDSPRAGSHKYADLVEDICDMLDRQGIQKATLIGHGMGGWACMCTALTKPHKISSLVVVDVSPVTISTDFTEGVPKILEAMKNVDFEKLTKKFIRSAKTRAEKELIHVVKNNATRRAIITNIKVFSNGKIGWSCNVDVLIKQFKHMTAFPRDLKNKIFIGPTLFLGGQLSEYIPPDDLPHIRDMFPRSLVRYVKGAGHNVHLDDPRGFLELVIDFVRDIIPD